MSVEIAGDSSVSSSKYAVKARSGPEVDLETGNWWEIGKIIEEEKEALAVSGSKQTSITDAVLPFIPRCCLRNMASEEKSGNTRMKHGVTTETAACAFFDISGFSKLASALQDNEVSMDDLGKRTRRHAMGRRAPVKRPSKHSSGRTEAVQSIASSHQKSLTSLTRRNLVDRSGEGSEKLALAITKFFSSLITKIHEAGGDIIKFAGDALICVWSLSNAEENTSSQFNLGNMIYHAIHCGFQLASLVEEVEDEDFTGEIKLALHVCVGAGEVNFVTLGGLASRWEFMITGQGYSDACNGVDLSKPGEIVVSNEAHTSLEEVLKKAEKLTGNVLHSSCSIEGTNYRKVTSINAPVHYMSRQSVVNSVKMAPALLSYVPLPVAKRLRAEKIIAPSLSNVSIIFVKFIGLELLDFDQMNIALCCVQRAVYSNDGVLRQFLVDDKGAVAIVVVGFPNMPSNDRSAKAVRIGLLIRSSCIGINIYSQIGITTGYCFCGCVGDPTVRCEYAAVGAVVNLAARLMGKDKKGQILCDQATYYAARESFRFTPLDEKLILKGVREPIQVYTPFGMLHRRKSVTDLLAGDKAVDVYETLGRESELNELSSLLTTKESLFNALGHLVVVSGVEGVGKTAFIKAWQHRVEHENTKFAAANSLNIASDNLHVAMYTGSGSEIDKNTLYAAWRPIFSGILSCEKRGDISSNGDNHSLYKCCHQVKLEKIDQATESIQGTGTAEESHSENQTRAFQHLLKEGFSEQDICSTLKNILPLLDVEGVLTQIVSDDSIGKNFRRHSWSSGDIIVQPKRNDIVEAKETHSAVKKRKKIGRRRSSVQDLETNEIQRRRNSRQSIFHVDQDEDSGNMKRGEPKIGNKKTPKIKRKKSWVKKKRSLSLHTGTEVMFRDTNSLSSQQVQEMIDDRYSMSHWVKVFSTSKENAVEKEVTDAMAALLVSLLLWKVGSKTSSESVIIFLDNAELLDPGSVDLLAAVSGIIPQKCSIVASYQNMNEKHFVPNNALSSRKRTNQVFIEQLLVPVADKLIHLKKMPQQHLQLILRSKFVNPIDALVLDYIDENASGSLETAFSIVQKGIDMGYLELNEENKVPQWKISEYALEENNGVFHVPLNVELENISSEAQDLSGIMSVFAVGASAETVAQLFEVYKDASDGTSVKQYLGELVACGLFVKKLPDHIYSFKTTAERDDVYKTLTFSNRTLYHKVCGKYYEKIFSTKINYFLGCIAYHSEGAQDYEKAVLFYERAFYYQKEQNAISDATISLENMLRIVVRKRKLVKKTASFRKLHSVSLCTASWFACCGALHCRMRNFRDAKVRFDEAEKYLRKKIAMGNCIKFYRKRNLLRASIAQVKETMVEIGGNRQFRRNIPRMKSATWRDMNEILDDHFPLSG